MNNSLNNFSVKFVGFVINIPSVVILILFNWGVLAFFTTNLIVKVLKINVVNNLQDVIDNSHVIGFIFVALFGCFLGMSFELMAFVFALAKKQTTSRQYAVASGVLAFSGAMMALPNNQLTFSFQSACVMLVYLLLGFAPPFSLIKLADLLSEKLDVKMKNGLTIREMVDMLFQEKMIELFNPKKKEKENPFTKLLVNTDNEPETRTYQRKIS
jgi:hypothetical protein